MDEENVVPESESSEPVQVETVAPESEEVQEPEEKEVKSFTQEELDKIVTRERHRARRQAEREFSSKSEVKKPDVTLSAENFNSVEDYAQALAEQKAEQIVKDREVSRVEKDIDHTFRDLEAKAKEKYADYEAVAHYAPISDIMADVIKRSDMGPEIAYYLGKNPEEAETIAEMHPLLQAKELGKLETKLANQPKETKKQSNAPAPPKPIGSKGSGAEKNLESMNMDEYREFRKKQNASWAR